MKQVTAAFEHFQSFEDKQHIQVNSNLNNHEAYDYSQSARQRDQQELDEFLCENKENDEGHQNEATSS